MLNNLIKSTCEQIDQEQYKENEKQSVIAHSLRFSAPCKVQKRF